MTNSPLSVETGSEKSDSGKVIRKKLFLENGEIACVKKGGDAFENSIFCAKNIEKLKINLVVVKKFKIRVVRISRFG